MSFAHLSNLESQPTTSTETGYSDDDPEFIKIAKSLSTKLFNLNSNISKLNHLLGQLGTKKDSAKTRDRLKDLLEETRDGFKEVGEGVKKVQTWPDVSPQQRFTQEKLGHQFTSSLTDFQAIQRLSAEKQRQYVTQSRTAMGDSNGADPQSPGAQESMPLVQQEQAQLQLASQSEVDYQEQLIQEREEEIRDIEQGIQEINEIFVDLGTMLNEQGQSINTIYENVSNVRDDTQAGSRELTAASRYQKNARNRACCLLLILAVVLLVVLLAIFVG